MTQAASPRCQPTPIKPLRNGPLHNIPLANLGEVARQRGGAVVPRDHGAIAPPMDKDFAAVPDGYGSSRSQRSEQGRAT